MPADRDAAAHRAPAARAPWTRTEDATARHRRRACRARHAVGRRRVPPAGDTRSRSRERLAWTALVLEPSAAAASGRRHDARGAPRRPRYVRRAVSARTRAELRPARDLTGRPLPRGRSHVRGARAHLAASDRLDGRQDPARHRRRDVSVLVARRQVDRFFRRNGS